MTRYLSRPCTAFAGARRIASGSLIDVALAVKAAEAAGERGSILTFDDRSGAVIDFDLRGTTAQIVTRLTERAEEEAAAARRRAQPGPDAPARRPGRPKLGVVAREVTLLPRHWEWLAAQPGGASQILRRLVEEARRSNDGQGRANAARETSYRFLAALAGDLPGFEEATRALFAGDRDGFDGHMTAWPPDIRDHALKLAVGAYPDDDR